MTDFPITPPPELVEQWRQEHTTNYDLARQAAHWGADQELLACGNYLKHCAQWEPEDVTEFYNYRRPKPPSLKEKALKALCDISIASFEQDAANTIREALEQLDD